MAWASKLHLAGDERDVLPARRKSLCGRWVKPGQVVSEATWENWQRAYRCQHCEKIYAGRESARAVGVENAVRPPSTPARPDRDPRGSLSADDF